MKQLPCIEDLRQRARRNVPKMFFDYAEAGSYNEETLRANRSDMERIKLRQRVLVNVDQRSTATTILGETGAGAAGARADRARRHDARRRRDHGLPRRAGGRHPVHAVHHVDQFDRGRGRRGRQAVLVPALRDARPRLHPRTDPARGGGEVQRADAHGRSSGARPAPQRRAQRPDRAAGDQDQERHRHRHQAGLGAVASSRASARPSAISPAT